MSLRAHLIALGVIVPHPELGRALLEAQRSGNPSVGPSLELPYWRQFPTLRRGPLLPAWDPAVELCGAYKSSFVTEYQAIREARAA